MYRPSHTGTSEDGFQDQDECCIRTAVVSFSVGIFLLYCRQKIASTRLLRKSRRLDTVAKRSSKACYTKHSAKQSCRIKLSNNLFTFVLSKTRQCPLSAHLGAPKVLPPQSHARHRVIRTPLGVRLESMARDDIPHDAGIMADEQPRSVAGCPEQHISLHELMFSHAQESPTRGCECHTTQRYAKTILRTHFTANLFRHDRAKSYAYDVCGKVCSRQRTWEAHSLRHHREAASRIGLRLITCHHDNCRKTYCERACHFQRALVEETSLSITLLSCVTSLQAPHSESSKVNQNKYIRVGAKFIFGVIPYIMHFRPSNANPGQGIMSYFFFSFFSSVWIKHIGSRRPKQQTIPTNAVYHAHFPCNCIGHSHPEPHDKKKDIARQARCCRQRHPHQYSP